MTMQTGIIFDIKEFSIFDGPGVRQTVFFKGCPLRCSWCHNPEGLSVLPQIMVSPSACIHCGKCKEVCPHPEKCEVCGKCVELCPENARRIAGEKMTSEELVRRIRKDAAYYKACGGGVTFSGGEPLLQSAFLLEVLEMLPDLHKTIETSAYAEAEIFDAVLEKIDYFMMDVKLIDREKHKKYTGVYNDRILRNAKALMESGKPHRLRVPLIPGVNDTEENLEAMAKFVSSVNQKTPIELLPYHKTAGAKYEMVGMEYKPIFDTEQKVTTHLEIFKDYGLECTVL